AISSTQVYRVERGGSHNDSHLVTVPVHIARRLGWPLPEKFHQEFKLDIPESERAFSYPNGAGDEVVDIPGKEQIIKIAAKGLSPQGKEAVRRALATPGLAKWAYLNASRGWGFTVDWTEGHGRHTRDHTVRVKIRTLPPTSYRESGQQKSRDEDKGIMYLRAYNAVTRKLKVGAGIVCRRLKNPSGTTSRNAPTIGGEINVDFSAIGKHGAARKDGRVAWKADMVDVEVDIDVTAIHTSSIAPNRWQRIFLGGTQLGSKVDNRLAAPSDAEIQKALTTDHDPVPVLPSAVLSLQEDAVVAGRQLTELHPNRQVSLLESA